MAVCRERGKGCWCRYKYLVPPPFDHHPLLLLFFTHQPPPAPTMSFFAHRINASFTVALFQNATGRTEVGFFVEGDQSGSLDTRTEQTMIHWPYTGPHSVPMNICRELTEGNRNTERALTCHAWGDVMPHPCTTCEEDQGRCVTLRNKFNNACSNCILKGRGVSCEWRTRYDLDSDEEYDYLPPTRAGARGTGAPAAIPATRARRAGRGDYPQRKRQRFSKTSRSNAELEAEGSARCVIDLTGD